MRKIKTPEERKKLSIKAKIVIIILFSIAFITVFLLNPIGTAFNKEIYFKEAPNVFNETGFEPNGSLTLKKEIPLISEIIILDDNELSRMAYLDWIDSIVSNSNRSKDGSKYWDCYCKEKENKGK